MTFLDVITSTEVQEALTTEMFYNTSHVHNEQRNSNMLSVTISIIVGCLLVIILAVLTVVCFLKKHHLKTVNKGPSHCTSIYRQTTIVNKNYHC